MSKTNKEIDLETLNLVMALRLGLITWFDYLEAFRKLKLKDEPKTERKAA
jgi:hypothetical protein